MHQQAGRGERDAHQRGDVLDGQRPQGRLARVAQEGPRRPSPPRRFPARLAQRLTERGTVGYGRDAQHHPGRAEVVDGSAVDELVDREADRQAAADQERRDGGEKGPHEADPAVAERMVRVGRPVGAAQ
jgi:hypothetical protein